MRQQTITEIDYVEYCHESIRQQRENNKIIRLPLRDKGDYCLIGVEYWSQNTESTFAKGEGITEKRTTSH